VILVIYAIYTEQSIGTLFVAAAIPGLLATAGYMLVVHLYARIAPQAAPRCQRVPWAERFAESRQVWAAAVVFLVVVIGIYAGWFSPTEAAAVGAAAVGLLAVLAGGMRLEGAIESLLATAETTALMFLILLGAELFSAALALSRLPASVSAWVVSLGLAPVTVLSVILVIYLVLGCAMESLAMVLLTLPVFVPVMLALDFGLAPAQVLVWFGILVLVSVEVGMISPPFGLNLFVINALTKDVPITETWRGVLGFCASDVVRLALLVAFPGLSLWLPGLT